jgi:hypothetical protein
VHHSEELLLLGALGFDSAFAAAGAEPELAVSDRDDFASEDLLSLDFDSLEELDPLEELEPLALSDELDDADEPSPLDAGFLDDD